MTNMNSELNDKQLLRYSRHILLNEVGIEGQEKFLNSTVLVVGCGGLGAVVLPYLAAAGVGKLIIADDDEIDLTNLQRQISYTEQDVGSLKAIAMQRHLTKINSECQIQTITKRLNQSNLLELLEKCDVVVDCCDNFETRQNINAAAVTTKTPLVSGAAVRFDGQLAVYRADQAQSPCYACLFDAEQADDGACAIFGVFAPLVGVIGTSQAVETLKILLNKSEQNHSQTGVLRCYNALSGDWQTFQFKKNPQCRVCGQ